MQNDADALAVIARVLDYAVAWRDHDKLDEEEKRQKALFDMGAGGYCHEEVIAWVSARLTETENSIAAADGTGMPEPPVARIIIDVSGGNVQEVYSSQTVDVMLVDWDNIRAGDSIPDEYDYPVSIADAGEQATMLEAWREEQHNAREEGGQS